MLLVAGGRKVFSPETLAQYRAAAAEPGAITAMLNWYRGMIRGGLQPELAGQCPVIETPTLVIWGDGDTALDIVCLDGLESYVADLAIERLPGVSHWVQEEVPDAVNALIRKFLSRSPVMPV